MKIKHTSVLFLTLLGATAGFPQVILNPVPARAIGQSILIPESGNPNLVEGRELYQPQGIAVDNSVSPPIVYVADTGNNRVLAWKNAASFSNGAKADLVIGQPDFFSTAAYGPGTTFSTGLNTPTGLAVRNGDLYVVDSGNNRVLRYDFEHPIPPGGQHCLRQRRELVDDGPRQPARTAIPRGRHRQGWGRAYRRYRPRPGGFLQHRI
jgi:sugar lactone lactonase YvrE